MIHTHHDPTRCGADVPKKTTFPRWRQCKRRSGHGPGGKYCRQHAPIAQRDADRERRLR
jgi:hypothetical protein